MCFEWRRLVARGWMSTAVPIVSSSRRFDAVLCLVQSATQALRQAPDGLDQQHHPAETVQNNIQHCRQRLLIRPAVQIGLGRKER
jgi:hypothetical protein